MVVAGGGVRIGYAAVQHQHLEWHRDGDVERREGFFHRRLAAGFIRRREAQAVARLQHPSIVTVFDYGTLTDGAAFLVMEFVPGEDLRQLLKRERQLAPERAADLLSGIAGGVESAHKAGILHRDLKPENILLPESGP